jgi:hypothetical protein
MSVAAISIAANGLHFLQWQAAAQPDTVLAVQQEK